MKKFNQSLMKNHLTREEMRSISGGSGWDGCDEYRECVDSYDCFYAACPRCVETVGNTNEKACGA